MPTSSQDQNSSKEEGVFQVAIGLAAAERFDFITEACGEDVAMRKRLEALLAAHDGPIFMAECARSSLEGDGKPGDSIGQYKLLKTIGTGGFGTVWMAEQREPVRRKVALKVIKLGMDTKEVIARFEQERQTLAMMEHPNIAKVFDAGATPRGRPFIAMELVRGVKITDYCDERKLPPRARLHLFIQVCKALSHAHQKGVIHRDLKPSNVLVTEVDGKPMVKVIDFGVAKAIQTPAVQETLYTHFEQMVGTPLYMSPEQTGMNLTDIDTRSDIYSLGVLLYQLLTGFTPIDDKTLSDKGRDEVRRFIREIDPPRPSVKVRSLRPEDLSSTAQRCVTEPARLPSVFKGELDWIVMKCLEKDRDRRYETANSLVADIQRHLDDEPVLARPPGTLYLLGKSFRRNRGLIGVAAILTLILCAATIISGLLAVRATRAEQVQSDLRKKAEQSGKRADEASKQAGERAYEADLSAATLFYQRGDSGQIAKLIEPYATEPDGRDLRGFEWWLLHDFVQGDQEMILSGHKNMVSSVAFSNDGETVASGDLDGVVHLWDARSGSLISTLIDQSERVISVSFSYDDRFLAVGDAKALRIYRHPGGELVNTRKLRDVRAVFSPSEALLAVGVNENRWYGQTGETYLWSYEDDPKAKDQRRLPNGGTRIAWRVDGQELATGMGPSRQANVWNSQTGQRLARGGMKSLLDVALARDGSWMAATTNQPLGPPRVFDRDGSLRKFDWIEDDNAYSLAASPTEDLLAIGTSGQRLILWDMESDAARKVLFGHRGEIKAVAFSRDGSRLVTGSVDETVRLWKAGGQPRRSAMTEMWTRLGMGSPILSPDGKRIAACNSNRILKIYESRTSRELQSLGYDRWPLRFSPDGKQLITLTAGGLLENWDTVTGESLGGYKLPFEPNWELMSTLSPDGRILSLCRGSDFVFYDLLDRKTVFESSDHGGWVLNTVFSPDSSLHAAASQSGQVIVRKVPSGETVHVFPHKQDLRGLAFSPDGKWLATGGLDNTLRIWDVANGAELAVITGHSQVVDFVAFSPDGKTLFSCGNDRELYLWNTKDWRSLGRLPLASPARSLVMSENGSVLAVSGSDTTIHLFRAPGFAFSNDVSSGWFATDFPKYSFGRPEDMPARSPETPERCLDLGDHYNVTLRESWTTHLPLSDKASLSDLKPGVHVLGGVPFDVRGLIQVYASDRGFQRKIPLFPTVVEDIVVRQTCARIHALVSSAWTPVEREKALLGKLVFYYADGSSAERHLKVGVDVLNWRAVSKPPVQLSGEALPEPVWHGSTKELLPDGVRTRLYQVSWENPRPELEIASVDFVALRGCPFLLALTLETE